MTTSTSTNATPANETHHVYRLDGEAILRAPLSHIGESLGPDSFLAEHRVVQPDGSVDEVFAYSGNAFRGQLRDCGARYLCERLGIVLPLPAFHLLFSGGSLYGDSNTNVERIRTLRRTIPLLSLFGAAIQTQMMAGKLRSGIWWPIAREAATVLPPRLHEEAKGRSWRTWTMEASYSRMDDARNDRLRPHLIDPALTAPAALAAALATAKATTDAADAARGAEQAGLFGDAPAPDARQRGRAPKGGKATNGTATSADGSTEPKALKGNDKPQQMRYTVESMAPGSRFWHRIDALDVTEVEMGALVSALSTFAASPHIGGMSRMGYGLVDLHYTYSKDGQEQGSFLTVGDTLTLSAEAKRCEDAYNAHLQDLYDTYLDTNAAPITALLGGQ
jgi:hypothetical protein